jgi:hypothetical protein
VSYVKKEIESHLTSCLAFAPYVAFDNVEIEADILHLHKVLKNK